ncbi:MAG: hypothetical protein WC602_01535 [archaeon]
MRRAGFGPAPDSGFGTGMNQAGQAYLLIMLFLSGMVVALLALNNAQLAVREGPRQHLLNNAEFELFQAFLTGITARDLNAPLYGTSSLLLEKARGEAQELQFCFAAYDQNSNYILGNFSGTDSNYSSTTVSASGHELPNDSTSLVSRQNLINDFNVLICGKQFDLTQSFQLHITLSRGSDSLVWSNLP